MMSLMKAIKVALVVAIFAIHVSLVGEGEIGNRTGWRKPLKDNGTGCTELVAEGQIRKKLIEEKPCPTRKALTKTMPTEMTEKSTKAVARRQSMWKLEQPKSDEREPVTLRGNGMAYTEPLKDNGTGCREPWKRWRFYQKSTLVKKAFLERKKAKSCHRRVLKAWQTQKHSGGGGDGQNKELRPTEMAPLCCVHEGQAHAFVDVPGDGWCFYNSVCVGKNSRWKT